MKYSLDCLDQLQDMTSYLASSYLRFTLSDSAKDQISYLNGAFCFLLDRNFFKENSGKEISEEIAHTILGNYLPKTLTEEAVNMSQQITDSFFLKDSDNFSSYFRSLKETESYLDTALDDDAGKLSLLYLKKLSSILEIDAKSVGLNPLKINEVVFLNATYAISSIFKGFFGKQFMSFKSFDFFDEVSLHAQRVRTEILD